MGKTSRIDLLDPELGSKRKQEILRVASSVYRDKGVDASLQDVADRLGITYNALYTHFANREDLIYQCLVRSSALLHQSMLDSAAGTGTGREKVLTFLRNFIDLTVEEQTPSGSLAVVLSANARLRLYRASLPARDLLVEMIDTGISDGSIAHCDPLVTASWILHTLYWWPEELAEEGQRTSVDVARTIIELVGRALTGRQ